MKMTNEEMYECVEALSGIEEKGKLGYAVARNLRKLKDACKEYIDLRDKAFREYGNVIDEANGRVSISTEIFDRELGEIKGIEHEVEIYQVPEDVFTAGNLTSRQMEKLLWMVSE